MPPALGIARGEHLAIRATNVPEWALPQMAAARIGAVLVTVNTNYRASKLEYVLWRALLFAPCLFVIVPFLSG